MNPPAPESPQSMLLVEEYFEAEDERFVPALRRVESAAQLAGFVDRWKKDPRPWARQQVLNYLNQPLNAIGHEVVVKRLFKHAEASGDSELMARFLVLFDGLVRQDRRTRWRYDWQTRESWSEESLVTRADVLPRKRFRVHVDPWTGNKIEIPIRRIDHLRLFSIHTRYYLRRRAWRYFRNLARQQPEDYPAQIARALAAYQDEDVTPGEHLLDCWGLLQACFGRHPALDFQRSRIKLSPGHALAELEPAPYRPAVWKSAAARQILLQLLVEAHSRLVRLWAMGLLRRDHADALAELDLRQLLPLLDSDDPDLRQFAAECLRRSQQVARLTVAEWLELLCGRSPDVLEVLCQTIQQHVAPERLSVEDCAGLAMAESAFVARLGFDWLSQREVDATVHRDQLLSLADAACFAVAGDLAEWSLKRLESAGEADAEAVLRFLDSLLQPIRESAWNWLVAADQPPAVVNDPVLWCRLLETPDDRMRLRIVDELQRRSNLPGVGTDQLAPVWAAVLLGVHRGGRQKSKAIRQIGDAILAETTRADQLLPVLVVAVRSVRQPEHRAGLAAVVGLVEECPELRPLVSRMLPELKLALPQEAQG